MDKDQLLGREKVTLDAKGRLALPARYRTSVAQLCADRLVLTEHPDGYLLLMPEPKWQSFAQQFVNAGHGSQWLKRILLGSACPVELDAAKRLLLPPELREAVGIDKQALLIGVGEYFEIWQPAEYAARRGEQRASRLAQGANPDPQALQASLAEVKW